VNGYAQRRRSEHLEFRAQFGGGLPGCLGVEHVRAEIDAVWPDEGAGLPVHGDLPEEGDILQRSKDATTSKDAPAEIELRHRPVGEADLQLIVLHVTDTCHSRKHGIA